MGTSILKGGFPLDKLAVGVVTLTLALLAWLVVTVGVNVPMTGVIDVTALLLFVGVWAVGMVAMMLPTLLPMIFAVVAATRPHFSGDPKEGSSSILQRSLEPVQFVLGYLGIWSAMGVAAYFALVVLFQFYPSFSSMGQLAGVAAGGTVFFAGVYQLSPLKQIALRACRSPMGFIMTRWRSGRFGRFLMGTDYGFFCTKCCWAFMAVLVVVGAMNLLWMVLFAAAIFVEKVGPRGVDLSKILGILLMTTGIILAVVPASGM